MTRKEDGAGRIVIPKSLREEPGLEEGVEVEFAVENGTLFIKPVHSAAPMVREEGLLLHRGRPTGNLKDAVEKHRTRRASDVIGGSVNERDV